jgi:micrococcal nuclease
VIDGDTIKLTDGRTVRYIGIDTPEVRRRVGERWVNDPEPFGLAASAANKALVAVRRVRLEFDVQSKDRYGRWLAYVYATSDDGAEFMVNERLLADGMAQPMTIPPNVRYAETFRARAAEARRAGRGLWSAR